MEKFVDARGDVCPVPVLKAKAAITEAGANSTVTVRVDNEIAKQNLEKMASQLGLSAAGVQLGDRDYQVTITVGEQLPSLEAAPDPAACGIVGDTVVQITSSEMGTGSEELGGILMKGFVFALTQLETPPDTILLYNGGAKLSCEGSPALEDLKKLQYEGTEILTCGTCLNYYGLSEQLAVGEVTNMYAIAEKLASAGRIIRP